MLNKTMNMDKSECYFPALEDSSDVVLCGRNKLRFFNRSLSGIGIRRREFHIALLVSQDNVTEIGNS